MNQTHISSSLEDYLEAIAEIIEKDKHAHAKEIAEKLKVTMPSVTNALQALASHGLVEYRPHSPVVLTAIGANHAAVIRRRHKVLRTFFAGVLKLDETTADDVACKVEHIIDTTTLSRLVILTEAIFGRDDCKKLRSYLDAIMPGITEDETDLLLPLNRLPEGNAAVVVKVAEDLRGLKKFSDLGIVPGTLLEFEGRAPFGDLLRIKVMGSSLTLRSAAASHIWVKPANRGVYDDEK